MLSNSDKEGRLHRYRSNATAASESENTYKGLAIHALPGLHEYVEGVVQRWLTPGSSILELAAGTGALSQRLKDRGFAVVATDAVSENFRLHGQVPFRTLDLDVDFSNTFDTVFDAIVAVEIVEHLENPRGLMRQISKLLGPGGMLVMTTPNIENSVSKAFYCRFGHHLWFSEQDCGNHGHITPLSMLQLKQCAGEAGLELTEASSYGNAYLHLEGWWKLRLLASAISVLSQTSRQMRGEILCAVFRKR